MSQPVNPANIAAAALVTQLFLSSIIAAGAFWVRRHERMDSHFYDTPSSAGRYSWMLLLFALATIALLIFSDEFSSIWQPLFGSVQFPLPRLSTCLMWVFLIDIVLITILVRQTHGSYKSPFAPVYFILPALAFFLREPPRHIVTYLLTIIAAFSLGLLYNDEDVKFEPPAGPYWFVSVACLLLSALVGYLTRPT